MSARATWPRAVPDKPTRDATAPLSDSNAEAAVVELCYDIANLRLVIAFLEPEDFSQTEAASIFAAQVALYRRGVDPSPAAVRRELGEDKWRAAEKFLSLVDLASNEVVGGVEAFAEIVLEYSRRRAAVVALNKMLHEVKSTPVRVRATKDLDDALDLPMAELRTALGQRRLDAVSLESAPAPDTEPTGAASGFVLLDQAQPDGRPAFRGWVPGYHLLAARSGKGKTVWGLNCAINVAAFEGVANYFSFEMPADQLSMRAEKIIKHAERSGDFSFDTAELARRRLRFVDFSDMAATTPQRVVDEILRARDTVLKSSQRLELCVVDYFQHPRWLGEKEMDGLRRASIELTRLEREGVGCLALAQFNRDADSEPDKRPSRAMIYGASLIVNNSMSVTFLHRRKSVKADDRGVLEIDLIIDKQRHGPGELTFHLDWHLSHYRIVG